MESLLCSYFRLCEPVKRVRQVLRLTDLINCFEVLNGTVDCLLPPPTNESSPIYTHLETPTETIALKKGMDNEVLTDLGEFIFKVSFILGTLRALLHDVFRNISTS